MPDKVFKLAIVYKDAFADLVEGQTLSVVCPQRVWADIHGLLAFAWDVRLITRPWGFPLNEIKVPVHLWHGTVDNSTTVAMARYMAQKIPNGKLTICEGEGHMLLIPHWEEILTTIIQMSVLP